MSLFAGIDFATLQILQIDNHILQIDFRTLLLEDDYQFGKCQNHSPQFLGSCLHNRDKCTAISCTL